MVSLDIYFAASFLIELLRQAVDEHFAIDDDEGTEAGSEVLAVHELRFTL